MNSDFKDIGKAYLYQLPASAVSVVLMGNRLCYNTGSNYAVELPEGAEVEGYTYVNAISKETCAVLLEASDYKELKNDIRDYFSELVDSKGLKPFYTIVIFKKQDVKVNDIKEPVVPLYNVEDKLIGWIKSSVSFLDVRAQIKAKGVGGYYIIYNKVKIFIDRNGELDRYPGGLYDEATDLLLKLL